MKMKLRPQAGPQAKPSASKPPGVLPAASCGTQPRWRLSDTTSALATSRSHLCLNVLLSNVPVLPDAASVAAQVGALTRTAAARPVPSPVLLAATRLGLLGLSTDTGLLGLLRLSTDTGLLLGLSTGTRLLLGLLRLSTGTGLLLGLLGLSIGTGLLLGLLRLLVVVPVIAVIPVTAVVPVIAVVPVVPVTAAASKHVAATPYLLLLLLLRLLGLWLQDGGDRRWHWCGCGWRVEDVEWLLLLLRPVVIITVPASPTSASTPHAATTTVGQLLLCWLGLRGWHKKGCWCWGWLLQASSPAPAAATSTHVAAASVPSAVAAAASTHVAATPVPSAVAAATTTTLLAPRLPNLLQPSGVLHLPLGGTAPAATASVIAPLRLRCSSKRRGGGGHL